MGIRNFLNRRNLPAEVDHPAAVVPDPSTGPEPASAVELTTEQLADLEAARAELLDLAAEVGVKSLTACPRDGSRWQDDPAAIRRITAVLRDVPLEDRQGGPAGVGRPTPDPA